MNSSQQQVEAHPLVGPRARSFRHWLASMLAGLLRAYGSLCYRTSVFGWTLDAERSLRATWDTGLPTVYTFWHDEFLALSLNAFCRRIQFPACVANDTFGGKVVARVWAAHGAPVVEIKRAEARARRIARIHEALLRARRLVIAADYGSPWFKARPTAQQLASATEGYVTAMHLHARHRLVVGYGDWRVHIPTPFNRYILHLSAPMAAQLATPKAIADALWSLRERARVPAVPAFSGSPDERTGPVRCVGRVRATHTGAALARFPVPLLGSGRPIGSDIRPVSRCRRTVSGCCS